MYKKSYSHQPVNVKGVNDRYFIGALEKTVFALTANEVNRLYTKAQTYLKYLSRQFLFLHVHMVIIFIITNISIKYFLVNI